MAFVTQLTLQSGDRQTLETVVDEIRSTIERKGAELNGPHSFPPEQLTVPQYDHTGRTLDTWEYTVYRRELELVGHEQLASEIIAQDYPEAIHIQAEVRQV